MLCVDAYSLTLSWCHRLSDLFYFSALHSDALLSCRDRFFAYACFCGRASLSIQKLEVLAAQMCIRIYIFVFNIIIIIIIIIIIMVFPHFQLSYRATGADGEEKRVLSDSKSP